MKKKKKIISIILLVVFVVVGIIDPNLYRSIIRMNHFRVDNESVSSSLIFGLHGYEMIISGEGEMSKQLHIEWIEKLTIFDGMWRIAIMRATVEEGVTSIPTFSLSSWTSLNTVSLPSTLKKIGVATFASDAKLNSINYNGTLEQWQEVVDNSPSWSNMSRIRTVVCTDGIYYLDYDANN